MLVINLTFKSQLWSTQIQQLYQQCNIQYRPSFESSNINCGPFAAFLWVNKATEIVTVFVCRPQTHLKLSSEVQNSGVHTVTVQTTCMQAQGLAGPVPILNWGNDRGIDC